MILGGELILFFKKMIFDEIFKFFLKKSMLFLKENNMRNNIFNGKDIYKKIDIIKL